MYLDKQLADGTEGTTIINGKQIRIKTAKDGKTMMIFSEHQKDLDKVAQEKLF